MGKRRKRSGLNMEEVVNFLNFLALERPQVSILIPVILLAWFIERWIFSFSNWVPLVVAVWATMQYGSYQRKIIVEDLNKKWKRIVLNTSPETPLEHCEWLNKLLTDVWSSYFNVKLSTRFSSIVEKRIKQRKPKFIERIELQEFSLGSCPPSLALQGIQWFTAGNQQRLMKLGFDWDTDGLSILMLAKLAKPFVGTARIVINSLHIKGDLLLMPILEGKAFLYSFLSTPEVRIGVAFGTGGGQSLPATELPGVSSWLVKLFTDTLVRTLVEPRRRCYSLPAVDLRKKAVGGNVYVTVVSASNLSRSFLKGSPSTRRQDFPVYGSSQESFDDKDLQTFVEVELEELTRKTKMKLGSNPQWDATFNMVLHDDTGVFRFNLYECTPSSVKCNYLASCEIKVKYVGDDSAIFWAIGPDSSAIAKHAEFCGKEVEMVVPFEEVTMGELTVRFVIKEWQFSDGSRSLIGSRTISQQSLHGSSNQLSRTGRKIFVTVMEGKDLMVKDKSGKCDPFVKVQYGKSIKKTKTNHTNVPVWNEKFEFEEIGGDEYLKIKCYTEETFGEDNIGSARVNLEGLAEGSARDVWIPLEKVNSGELRLKVEAEGQRASGEDSGNGWIELVLIEAKDLVAADFRGTSDPFVVVQYGNLKKRTKVMPKTLSPQWHQTLEFSDDGSPLILHVKDHNALLPTSSIGDCVVDYDRLPPNQMSDKWIPLQGVKRGEIHIQITRKVPELEKRPSLDSQTSLSRSRKISNQMKQLLIKLQTLVEDEDLEELTTALSELQSLEDLQEDYIVQLETEQTLLLNKIKQLGQEIMNASPRRSSPN